MLFHAIKKGNFDVVEGILKKHPSLVSKPNPVPFIIFYS